MIEKFFTKPKTYAITDDRVYTEYNQWGTGNLEDCVVTNEHDKKKQEL